MQNQLQNRIDVFQQKATAFLPVPETDANNEDCHAATVEFEDFDDTENARWDDLEDVYGLPHKSFDQEDGDALPPQRQVIPLPSSLSDVLHHPDYELLVAHELQLRIDQANDALGLLKMAIAKKSLLYRGKVRLAKGSYAAKTRAYDDVHAVQLSIQQSARIYSHARRAMVRLGASADVLSVYAVLLPANCGVSTAVVNPNERGHRYEGMSWIWRIHQGDEADEKGMTECK